MRRLPEPVEVEADLLVIGGGTAGCVAAAKAKEGAPGLKVVIAEKAGLERSGCLAPGLNAIYSYLHEGDSPEDYVRWVRYQACGLLREDLALTIIGCSAEVVRELERRGLPVVRDGKGRPARQGRFGIRVRGGFIKPILAEWARSSGAEVFERVNLTDLIVRDGKVWGAVGFGVRDGRPWAFYAKATIVATGGACGLYRWLTRPWYPPSNTGGGLAMGIRAGAEMTSFEARFVPIRIKDVSAPIGVAAVGFRGTVRNAQGQAFMTERYAHLGGERAPISVRVYAPTEEVIRGRGPCVIDMRGIPEEAERELIEMYLHGWPSFLLFLRANGIKLSERPLEIAGLEPYITGSHSLPGYWVDERRMTTLPGLFAAGDCAGGMSLKHAGGALAEGAIAGRAAAEEAQGTKRPPKRVLRAEARRLLSRAMAPLGRKEGVSPGEFLGRLQIVLEEYAGGRSTGYRLSEGMLLEARRRLEALSEQVPFLKAEDPHQLLRACEATDLLEVGRVMVEHLLYRKETRWPGFQTRVDFPHRDDFSWLCFVNSRKDEGGRIEVFTRPYEQLVGGDRYRP